MGLSNVSFRVADAMDLPYRDETFDRVLIGHTIFFMPDVASALVEWRQVVKGNGGLAISTQGKVRFRAKVCFTNEGNVLGTDSEIRGADSAASTGANV